jgi:hypothetical protein
MQHHAQVAMAPSVTRTSRESKKNVRIPNNNKSRGDVNSKDARDGRFGKITVDRKEEDQRGPCIVDKNPPAPAGQGREPPEVRANTKLHRGR